MMYRNTKLTATNTKNTPAIVKYIISWKNSIVFDFGAGKCWETTRNYIFKNGGEMYTPYDKYWEIGEIPAIPAKYTHILCANVLNVIEDEEELYEALTTMRNIANRETEICIQIYEGDKSGIGKETTKGYQRNAKTSEYIQYIENVFPSDIYAIGRVKNYLFINRLPWA